MKTTAISMLATFTLLFATPALAQESSRADFDEMLDAFRGRWVGDVTWITDWKGFGEKGDKVTCYIENTVVEDGNAILSRFFGGDGSVTSIMYYDAAAKQIKQSIVTSGGTTWNRTLRKDGGKWIVTANGSNADGSEIKGRWQITVSENGNKHTYSGTTNIDGQPVDNFKMSGHELTTSREVPQAVFQRGC